MMCALSMAAVVTACTTSGAVQQIDHLESVAENPRILLMPPDIRYYLLTAGGVPEPNVEWTEAAQKNFTAAVSDYARSIGTNLKLMDPHNLSPTEIRYEELHSAVGMTILSSHFGAQKLPAKNGEFDWSLGPDISIIGEDHEADYALFSHYRDYQASGGRVAFAVLAAAAGYVVPAGSQGGFASLVDLKTGDIVWFNVVTAGKGELRDEQGAIAAVNELFEDIPGGQPQE
jgi:hypothetical protein